MDISQIPPAMLNLAICLGIFFGFIHCFFGYRIFKIMLGLTGFALGFILAIAAGYTISNDDMVVLVIGIVGGLIGAGLLVVLYMIGVFVIGALLGGLIASFASGFLLANPEPAIVLISAILSGVLALFFQKLMIILSTSFSGAWGVVVGISFFVIKDFKFTNLEFLIQSGQTQLVAMTASWVVLGLTGLIVQYRALPKEPVDTRDS